MKITRRQLRKLISESINEMDDMKRNRNMAAATMTDEELVVVLKSNFKSDIYEDDYDEHIANSDTVNYEDRDRNSDY